MIYKILSVGNNEVDNDDLSSCLTKFAERFQIKFELTSIKTGISFLSSYKKRYDLIFISIELPDINGIQATRELRKIDQDTFLILLSNASHYALDGYELGASDYILKPIKPQNPIFTLTYNISLITLPLQLPCVILVLIKILN